jgi:hypothetical protein
MDLSQSCRRSLARIGRPRRRSVTTNSNQKDFTNMLNLDEQHEDIDYSEPCFERSQVRKLLFDRTSYSSRETFANASPEALVFFAEFFEICETAVPSGAGFGIPDLLAFLRRTLDQFQLELPPGASAKFPNGWERDREKHAEIQATRKHGLKSMVEQG